jgi:hypothetical protein
MNYFRYILLVLAAAIIIPLINAQELITRCGSIKIDTEASRIARDYMASSSSRSTVSATVRVYVHIFRNTDGSNAATSINQVQNEINNLISDYNPGNICFALIGVDFIDNSNLNSGMNVETDWALMLPYLRPGCLDIFYHSNLSDNIGLLGGWAYNIPGSYCSVSSCCLGSQRVTSHEVGHCLGLIHTHETAFGEEHIDGTNCSTKGDEVCDTPADPFSHVGESCFSATNACSYTGNCEDPDGATNYSPPYNNIMSYWATGSYGCSMTTITAGQFSRAHSFLVTSSTLMALNSVPFAVYGPASSSFWVFESGIYTLETVGSVDLFDDIEASLQAEKVTLKPGFHGHPNSNGIISVKVPACNF